MNYVMAMTVYDNLVLITDKIIETIRYRGVRGQNSVEEDSESTSLY